MQMRALTADTLALFDPIKFSKLDRFNLSLDKGGTSFLLRMFAQRSDGMEGVASQSARSILPARFPERMEVKYTATVSDGSTWKIAATDISANLIGGLLPADNTTIEKDAQIVLDYLALTLKVQMRNAENFATFKLTGKIPDNNLILHPHWPLAPFQQVACINALTSEGYALFAEQGTGKTPTTIARVSNEAPYVRATKKRPMRVLIVMPNNVRLNWVAEFEKFATCTYAITVLRGQAIERQKLFIELMCNAHVDAQIMVISYGTLVQDWKYLQKLSYDLAIVDEGHSIKDPERLRAKTCLQVRDQSAKRMLLTGTPILNTPLDLYAQLEFLGRGNSGFASWKNFKKFYGVYDVTDSGHKALVGFQNAAFMKERLSCVSFIISKKEALPDLPDKVFDIVEVEMSEEQGKFYSQLAETMQAELDSEIDADGPESFKVNHVLTKLLKLAQVTSGFITIPEVYSDEGELLRAKSIKRFTPNPKLDALVELLRGKDENSKTLIWSNWIADINLIAAKCEELGIDAVTYYGATNEQKRKEAEYRFNCDRKCKVFIGNPAAGGVGLNLLGYPPGKPEGYDTNADHTIYFAQDWASWKRSQSGDRNHRNGTRVQVRETDLVAPGTIDEEIRKRVLEKRITAHTIQDVRDILKNVLQGWVKT